MRSKTSISMLLVVSIGLLLGACCSKAVNDPALDQPVGTPGSGQAAQQTPATGAGPADVGVAVAPDAENAFCASSSEFFNEVKVFFQVKKDQAEALHQNIRTNIATAAETAPADLKASLATYRDLWNSYLDGLAANASGLEYPAFSSVGKPIHGAWNTQRSASCV